MKHILLNHFLTKGHLILSLLFLLIFLFPNNSWSQKKQLSPSSKVVKVAYIDNIALRTGYKALSDIKEGLAKENTSAKKSYEQSLQNLDQQTIQLLTQDSLLRGQHRLQIVNDASSKRSKMTADFQSAQKKRNYDKNVLLQEFEKKIVLAIERVINEKGFTEVRSLDKNTTIQNGINITDLVLKKLN